jgi:hypothetical protein
MPVAMAGEVNNFSLNIATINGSGSQTSNGVLLRVFFKMGIPVTGKNLFPSNIQGLPTWYIIRLSKDGYLAHRDPYEIAVCMNGRTAADDMAKVAEGGIVLYDDSLPVAARRPDVTYYPMPVGKLVKEAGVPVRAEGLHRQHGLRGRAGPPARHRHEEIEDAVDVELRRQAEADRAEHEHGAPLLRSGHRKTSPKPIPTASSR